MPIATILDQIIEHKRLQVERARARVSLPDLISSLPPADASRAFTQALAIAIRTAVIKNDKLFIQAGAGIVADSQPQMEWEETLNKARAIVRAVQMANESLRVD